MHGPNRNTMTERNESPKVWHLPWLTDGRTCSRSGEGAVNGLVDNHVHSKLSGVLYAGGDVRSASLNTLKSAPRKAEEPSCKQQASQFWQMQLHTEECKLTDEKGATGHEESPAGDLVLSVVVFVMQASQPSPGLRRSETRRCRHTSRSSLWRRWHGECGTQLPVHIVRARIVVTHIAEFG